MSTRVFSFSILLGNDAMQTGNDLAALLRKLADRVSGSLPRCDGTRWPLHDENGNRVGTWEITGDDEATEES